MATNNSIRHWPTMLLGIIVAAIFLLVIFSYQINMTQTAVLTTLGSIDENIPEPGFHFRWPYPIQIIFKFDSRSRCFDGNVGKLEETLTADGQNIIVGVFVIYKIADVKQFFTSLENVPNAENQLNIWMRGIKDANFGRYKFNQLINTDPKKMKLREVEAQILQELATKAASYGIAVESVGISSLNIPKSISEKVFERMIQERNVVAAGFRAEGAKEAEQIKIETNSKKLDILTNAEAQAKEIRAKGDAEAAQYYIVFKKSPELAAFLRKLDSLRKVMKSKTTLILSTNTAPFDLLKPNADTLEKPAAGTGK
ncbi:MAG: protease modulator HflC [Victivallaceae bacterium]